jgi:hypothetical protein
MSGKGARSTSLINRAEVRRLVLALFEKHRPAVGITRVSGQALDQIDAWLRSRIQAEVHRHPSVGKTFRL